MGLLGVSIKNPKQMDSHRVLYTHHGTRRSRGNLETPRESSNSDKKNRGPTQVGSNDSGPLTPVPISSQQPQSLMALSYAKRRIRALQHPLSDNIRSSYLAVAAVHTLLTLGTGMS